MKVNLGCGHLPLEGYVNVDRYADEADVHADVLAVHFERVDELVAYHLFEHLTHSDANLLLMKAKAWMRDGGTLEIEVPDMAEIFDRGTGARNWEIYTYGNDTAGEKHLWGYTQETLAEMIRNAGWVVDECRRFLSPEPQRIGMPCIAVRAHR